MKKTIIAIACTCALSFCLFGCGAKNETTTTSTQTTPPAVEQVGKNPSLTGLDNVNYSYKKLSNETVNYLKNQSEYRDLYTNKKFAVYYVGDDCACAKGLIDNIEPLKNNPEISKKYNFYPQQTPTTENPDSTEITKAANDFADICQEFCIVNPNTNEVFTINNIDNEQTAQLSSIFEQLKNW